MTRPPWWLDACRLRVGLLKRPQPQVPHLTRPNHDAELDELDRFAAWLVWFEGSKKGLRPKVWKRVPAYAWKIWGEYAVAHPKPPIPPPKPPPLDGPPSRWKNTPWTIKHVHISHGLRTVDPVWTIDQLIGRARQAGCGAIVAQIGGDCPDPDWAEHCRALYAAGKQAGLRIGAWGRMDYIGWEQVKQAIRSVLPLDGVLADVEARCSDQQLPEHLVAEFPGLPLGVIATGAIDQAFDNHSPQQVAARFGDYFDYVGQDYHKTELPLTPDDGENFVYWRSTAKVAHGFRHLPDAANHWHVPVVMPNAETCPPLEAHREWLKGYTPHYGVWDGELVEANGEWDVFASI
jgi:hypothetical protein